MAEKPTAADAELILKMYDLRREAEMRKARAWVLTQFWPNAADDVVKIAGALGTQENAWFRQVSGYWEMVASMADRGVVNPDMFLEPSFSGEMFFLYAKLRPILKDLREKLQAPTMFRHVESVINSSKSAQDFLAATEVRVANRKKAMAEAAKA
jgi:hypothetical protein